MDDKYAGMIEGNLQGSATGASVGAAAGPYGAIIGGAIGGTLGAFTGWNKAKKQQEAERRKREAWEKAQKLLAEARMRSEQQRMALQRSAMGPLNNTMVGMYGPQANQMPARTYAPQAKKQGA